MKSSPLYGNTTDLQYFYVDVYVGDGMQKQSLIVDTGSGIVAFPCKSHCKSCGNHLNPYYDLTQSSSKYIYNCNTDSCSCIENNMCHFLQGYSEGSSYSGFLVRDKFYFG